MSGKKWILLVSGSKGWEHYKHQANVCLHYQIIKEHKIPDEQIVVMMYDDIAYNSHNPTKGQIISVVEQSKNVYSGVPKDYTEADLTPENFLSALQGKEGMDKKVIASGPDDNIYIYMTGVGQEDGFQFPEKALDPKAFTDVLKSMHGCNKFSKMVIFMDSDYSGSMFEGLLPTDIDVFALASCHKFIENTPTDYDDQREVYLSDLFSSTWLTYLSTADFKGETFHELVKTKQSKFLDKNGAEPCPCVFGKEEIAHCHISDFLEK